jgi:hypothetical protein
MSEALFSAEIFDRLTPGEMLKYCLSSTAIRDRCRVEESIQKLFLTKLVQDLVYVVDVLVEEDDNSLNLGFITVNPINTRKAMNVLDIKYNDTNIRNRLARDLNAVIELQGPLGVGEGINVGQYQVNLASDDRLRFNMNPEEIWDATGIFLPRNLVIEILREIQEDPEETSRKFFVYRDGTILLFSDFDLDNAFGDDFAFVYIVNDLLGEYYI